MTVARAWMQECVREAWSVDAGVFLVVRQLNEGIHLPDSDKETRYSCLADGQVSMYVGLVSQC